MGNWSFLPAPRAALVTIQTIADDPAYEDSDETLTVTLELSNPGSADMKAGVVALELSLDATIVRRRPYYQGFKHGDRIGRGHVRGRGRPRRIHREAVRTGRQRHDGGVRLRASPICPTPVPICPTPVRPTSRRSRWRMGRLTIAAGRTSGTVAVETEEGRPHGGRRKRSR